MLQKERAVGTPKRVCAWLRILGFCPVVALTVAAVLPASAATGQFIANNTPKFVTTAKNLGPENPSKVIDLSIWLNLHNREALDSVAQELYDPASSHYHEWLQRAAFAEKFAPTAEEAKTVGKFLSSHNLPVVAVGPYNMFVRARGTVADVEKAFRVQIDDFDVNGKTLYANTSDPYVEEPAAALVGAVYGLDDQEYKHPLVARAVPNQPSTPDLLAATASDSGFFTTDCFTGVKTETYSTNGSFPIATYTGNGYTDNIAGCGYTPPEIHTAYNLTGLYEEGYDGTGQTIVIIDWCGSLTIMDDANAFSARFGLPPLTSSNFHILNPNPFMPSTCAAPDVEINIDVEWAHAIAPGANIDLVVPPSASFMDVDDAQLYAIANGLGNVISGSYGSPELYTPLAVLNEENLINQIAAWIPEAPFTWSIPLRTSLTDESFASVTTVNLSITWRRSTLSRRG